MGRYAMIKIRPAYNEDTEDCLIQIINGREARKCFLEEVTPEQNYTGRGLVEEEMGGG